ncbi:cell wall metabolism sensor histidine kinase WalK [Phenylobacterium aquaticum]|uniref:sensor histidine kinase n=1 Tax=Phenylobacterium aquaticum TaxID=1763816 RepID=UPI0026F1D4A8|nr:ATP-binding protein [Phenylobacterium aquaticum]
MVFSDSLAARIIAILLAGLAALFLIIGATLVWPSADVKLFDLPLPRETLAIAEALEGARDGPERGRILAAVDSSVVSAHLQPDFPEVVPGLPAGGRLAKGGVFADYATALSGREFRVDTRRRFWIRYLTGDWRDDGPAPVRLSVRLRTGEVLVVERRPSRVLRTYLLRGVFVMGAVAAVLLSALVLAVRQTARPVAELAAGVRRFATDLDAPDLTLEGPREIRELAADVNDMTRRIRALIGERTRILAAVAHDMRTYLTRLRLRAEFIDDANQRERATVDIEEMSSLLDDTLLFAGLDAGLAVFTPVDIVAELAAFTETRTAMGEPVTWRAPPHLPAVRMSSPLALRRMVGNLVDNAIRYGGEARLAAGVEAAQVWIEVTDRGEGVAAEDLARILEPFSRLEPSRARQSGGAGLGLSIVQGLAQAQGGALTLRNSLEPGAGLIARLSFPAG